MSTFLCQLVGQTIDVVMRLQLIYLLFPRQCHLCGESDCARYSETSCMSSHKYDILHFIYILAPVMRGCHNETLYSSLVMLTVFHAKESYVAQRLS